MFAESKPFVFSFEVNFVIFLKILRMLISKLKAQQMSFHDYKYRYVTKDRIPGPFFKILSHQKLVSFP